MRLFLRLYILILAKTVLALRPLGLDVESVTEQMKPERSNNNLIQTLTKVLEDSKDSRKSSLWTPELKKKAEHLQARINANYEQQLLFKKMARQASNKDKSVHIPFGSLTTIDPDLLQASIAAAIQAELVQMIAGQPTMQLAKPYVEHLGKNDFLVMGHQAVDHHVTVIPNDIFYAVQKPCVNWLNECSITGLRDKLLERVKSPYR